tara:strand:- start:327 stop:611 length:285 start_codon:yes stop_codon:yes gene_type:complete
MSKAISADSQIHISVALLIKAGILIAIVVGSWYQAQMKFAQQGERIEDLEDKVVVLTASVEGMEQEHIQELEAAKISLEKENKTLMERLGLKRK